MRTSILAVLGLALTACAGEISSSGGDDTGGGATCGNGKVETGEQCDDGNTVAGDGCSATCQTEQAPTPHVTLSVDKPTLTSDLGIDNTVVVTATSEMGFAGTVTLGAAVTDPTNAAITDWTSSLDQSSLTLTAGGTATANLKVSALGDAAMLGGTVTLTATGAATPGTATVGVTFNPVLHITFGEDAQSTCVYPTVRTWKIKATRSLAVYNGGTDRIMVVHTGNAIDGLPHEGSAPGTAAGAAYMKTLPTPNQADQIYCHNDNPTTQLLTGNANDGPVIQTVP